MGVHLAARLWPRGAAMSLFWYAVKAWRWCLCVLVPWSPLSTPVALGCRGVVSLRVAFDHPPDADGVAALGGLGCALSLGFVDGCRAVVSLCVACRPHPRCRWCRGVVWSCPCTSVRLRRWHGAPVLDSVDRDCRLRRGSLFLCIGVCLLFMLSSSSPL
jgi:hypothetical protein